MSWSSNHPRVLLIDDDQECLQSLQNLLDRSGYASSITHFEGSLNTDGVDALVLHTGLHEILGDRSRSSVRRLRTEAGKRPLLVVTAVLNGGTRHELLDAGADDVLEKPITVQILVKALAALGVKPGSPPAETE